ncbi:uncharacterized protein G2W53_005527 [Senna tora]|uniref:RNase H type-1 domain-containing protein n=1 Tax=Senna tora TaxID=362788 RepID=A0A835CDT8_9FABA|nr:uncharacterized protein G2W53_005527 [Senna tora]
MVYQFISGRWDKNHPLNGLASEIEDLISKDWDREVKFSLAHREGNRLAHGLPKLGHSLDWAFFHFVVG